MSGAGRYLSLAEGLSSIISPEYCRVSVQMHDLDILSLVHQYIMKLLVNQIQFDMEGYIC